MKKPMLTIEKTIDYSKFKKLKGNREVQRAHVNVLIKVYTLHSQLVEFTPILINEKWEVVDGQHRVAAWEALGLPVYYAIYEGLSLADVVTLNNSQKPWTPDDFARSWVEQGRSAYQTYLDFKAEFHINHDILLRFLSLASPSILNVRFRSGDLLVTDEEKSRDLCSDLVDFKQYYSKWNQRSFAFGFYYLWRHPEYEHDRMLMKLQQQPTRLVACTSPEQYADLLSEIYNYGFGNDNRVWFSKQK